MDTPSDEPPVLMASMAEQSQNHSRRINPRTKSVSMLNRINASEATGSQFNNPFANDSSKESQRIDSVPESQRDLNENSSFNLIRKQMAPFRARDTIRVLKSQVQQRPATSIILDRTATVNSMNIRSVGERELEEEFNEKQYKMLGSEATAMDRLVFGLSHPKFFTSMYNINGRQVFSSRCTLLSCLGFFLAFLYVFVIIVAPLFFDQIVDTQFHTQQLTTTFGLAPNHSVAATLPIWERNLRQSLNLEPSTPELPWINYTKFFEPISVEVSGDITCADLQGSFLYLDFMDSSVFLFPNCTNSSSDSIELTFNSPDILNHLMDTLKALNRSNTQFPQQMALQIETVFRPDEYEVQQRVTVRNRQIHLHEGGSESGIGYLASTESTFTSLQSYGFYQENKAFIRFDVDQVIESQTDHWGQKEIVQDGYSLAKSVETRYSDNLLTNPPAWFPQAGGVLIVFDFQNQLYLEHSQASIEAVAIEVGSTLSIIYGAYILIRFFLGIKYRNWLGSYLLEKEKATSDSGASSPSDSSETRKPPASPGLFWTAAPEASREASPGVSPATSPRTASKTSPPKRSSFQSWIKRDILGWFIIFKENKEAERAMGRQISNLALVDLSNRVERSRAKCTSNSERLLRLQEMAAALPESDLM